MVYIEHRWREFVTPIVEKVMASSAEELLALNNLMIEEGVPNTRRLRNLDPDKKPLLQPLPGIDPFTFLAHTACWYVNLSTKLPMIRFLEKYWELPQSNCPEEQQAFPMAHRQSKRYYFSLFAHDRNDDIDSLWRFATLCYEGNGNEAGELFPRCLDIKHVGLVKLTTGLFWLNPERYLSLDMHTMRWLQKNKISETDDAKTEVESSWTDYQKLCTTAMAYFGKEPYKICYDAYNPKDVEERHTSSAPGLLQTEHLLKAKHQIILQGPPGTGKTYHAKQVAVHITGENSPGNRWQLVQFHPSYNYEDFVRGIQVGTENSNAIYRTVDRILATMAKAAKEDNKGKPYVLIIDEINRANISAVLGELIYALEYRGNTVSTPYDAGDGAGLELPKNLYIIGTMNTADRTIGHIDYAVRRRFYFVDLSPDIEVIKDENARLWFKEVDELMKAYSSTDFSSADVAIGHSYFLTDKAKELRQKLLYQVMPILREYLKDGVLSPEAKDRINALESSIKAGDRKPPSASSQTDPEPGEDAPGNAQAD